MNKHQRAVPERVDGFYRALLCLGMMLSVSVSAQEAPPRSVDEAPPPNVEEATLQGRWRLRGSVGAAERRRDAAIEAATDDMSIFTRGIARRRLKRSTPIHRSLEFRGSGGGFRAHIGPYHLDFAPDGGRHPFTDPIGDNEMRARQRFRGRRLIQTMRNDDATLTHSMMLSPDGQRITLTVKISSHHLPGDVIYRTTYARE